MDSCLQNAKYVVFSFKILPIVSLLKLTKMFTLIFLTAKHFFVPLECLRNRKLAMIVLR